MNSLPANNPDWLVKKIIKMGGTISFYDFMNFALNDPINGYYGSGKAELGVQGDFVTSPSLSDDFAFLIFYFPECLPAVKNLFFTFCFIF